MGLRDFPVHCCHQVYDETGVSRVSLWFMLPVRFGVDVMNGREFCNFSFWKLFVVGMSLIGYESINSLVQIKLIYRYID